MFNLIKKISNKSISLVYFNFFLAIWLGLFLNYSFYKKLYILTPYQGFDVVLFIAASILIVIAAYNLIFQFINWKVNAKFFAYFLIILGGFCAYFVNNLGVVVNSDQVQNILETDLKESKDLMSVSLIFWSAFFVIIPVILVSFLKIKRETIKKNLVHKLISSLISIALIGGLLFVFYIDYAAIFRENRDLKGLVSPQNAIGATYSYIKHKMPEKNVPFQAYGRDAKIVNTKNQAKIMVLVIGETARAQSFSLNGYAKNTNPELSQLDIINFKQVSSCGTSTAISVPCIFSGMTRADYEEKIAKNRENLLDIAQRAGYKVTWIENNSGCKDVCNRVENYQFPEEIKKKWCNAENECFDEILVDSLKAYLKTIPENDTTPRLIVLHQMGSHGPAYFKRVPKEFKKFQPMCDTNAIQGCSSEQLINTYDNTILYTDHVLARLIQTLKEKSDREVGFWYVSDHGESTGEQGLFLHSAPYAFAPQQQTHVPMLMWFSDQWKQQQPQQIECLMQQQNANLSHDQLFPTLLTMLNIKTEVIDNKVKINCVN